MRVVRPVIVLLAMGLSASACAADGPRSPTLVPPVLPSTASSSSFSTPSATATPDPTVADGTPAEDELADGSARHVVRSGGLTVTIDYTTAGRPRWSDDGGVSLQLAVSARDDGARNRKVYLSKATLRYAADDGSTSLEVPDPVTDTANIDPGYLVTRPNQYVQIFTVPAVDSAAQHLAIGTKLEFVSLVDKKAKDYTKRSVSDEVRTVVTA